MLLINRCYVTAAKLKGFIAEMRNHALQMDRITTQRTLSEKETRLEIETNEQTNGINKNFINWAFVFLCQRWQIASVVNFVSLLRCLTCLINAKRTFFGRIFSIKEFCQTNHWRSLKSINWLSHYPDWYFDWQYFVKDNACIVLNRMSISKQNQEWFEKRKKHALVLFYLDGPT